MPMASIFDIAGSAMTAQSIRLNTTASNIANAQSASSSVADTYRGRHPVFASMHGQALQSSDNYWNNTFFNDQSESAGVRVLGIVESDAPLQKRFEPQHPLADDQGYVNYPNVDIVEEMANMISASRAFQINVEVMNSAKQMVQRALTMGQ